MVNFSKIDNEMIKVITTAEEMKMIRNRRWYHHFCVLLISVYSFLCIWFLYILCLSRKRNSKKSEFLFEDTLYLFTTVSKVTRDKQYYFECKKVFLHSYFYLTHSILLPFSLNNRLNAIWHLLFSVFLSDLFHSIMTLVETFKTKILSHSEQRVFTFLAAA